MIATAELETGVTFADAGIDVSRCRGAGDCKVICPKCHHTHSPGNQRNTDLSVNVAKGAWKCHRCGWASGLLEVAYERNGWKQGAKVNNHVGTKAVSTTPPTLHNAAPVAVSELPTGLAPWAVDWFRDRGIPQEAVEAFGVTASEWRDEAGIQQRAVHFPYRVNGEIVNVKHRRLPKHHTQVKGAAKSLFNVDRAEGEETIVFVEGELDAIACAVAGWVAVSAPDGAPGEIYDHGTTPPTPTGKVAAVGNKLNALNERKSAAVLAAAKRIVIATDGDLEGTALGDELIATLGVVRCWRVTWPADCKDANDVLVRYGAEELDRVLGAARPVDMPGIAEFMREWDALETIWRDGYDMGVSTGWEAFDAYFRPRLGTINLVTGVPGSGKTTFMLDLLSRLANLHGWKGAIFSPESGSTGTLYGKLVQIAADAPLLPGADDHMSYETLQAAARWVNDRFWRIDAAQDGGGVSYGTVTVPDLIARIEALVLRRGINMVYIDPWNRLEATREKGLNETEHVAYCVNMLHRVALRHNLFLVLVAHPPKLDDENKMPGIYNISGSAHWANMGDVIIGIQRNKKTEPKNRTTVEVLKHREEGISGELGETYFYFDGRRRRFYTDPAQIPMGVGSAPFVEPELTHIVAVANGETSGVVKP